MPILGLANSLVVLLCLNLCIGIVLCAAEHAMARKRVFILVTALAVMTGFGLAKMPRNVFRHIYEVSVSLYPGNKLIYYKEDVVGTVTVEEMRGHRRMLIDNLDVAGTSHTFLSSHKSLGHLPMLLHPNPQTVFVLGFGGGGTAYAISTYPEVERIDSAELSRSVVEAAPMFTAINHNVMSDPRLSLEVTDGRHFLLTTQRMYDVISVDLLWPQTAGSGSLYTKEFYELCHQRLNDDGLMVEWIHYGFVSKPYLQTILRTIRDVFPYTSLWSTRRQEHLLVVASKAPLRIDFQRLARRMNNPATQRDLAEDYLGEPAAFVNYFIADGKALARFVQGSDLVNTDNLPLIEYKLPRVTSSGPLDNLQAIVGIKQSVLPLLENVSDKQKERLLVWEQSFKLVLSSLIAFHTGNPELAIARCREALRLNPDDQDAKYLFYRYTYPMRQ